MIIKLTLIKNEDGLPDVLINTDHILYASEGPLSSFGYEGRGTVIKMTDDAYPLVKETPKEILDKISTYEMWNMSFPMPADQ